MPFAATWMNLEIIMLCEISERQILYDITYMWNQKVMQLNLHKIEIDSRPQKTNSQLANGKAGDKLEVWD